MHSARSMSLAVSSWSCGTWVASTCISGVYSSCSLLPLPGREIATTSTHSGIASAQGWYECTPPPACGKQKTSTRGLSRCVKLVNQLIVVEIGYSGRLFGDSLGAVFFDGDSEGPGDGLVEYVFLVLMADSAGGIPMCAHCSKTNGNRESFCGVSGQTLGPRVTELWSFNCCYSLVTPA